MDYYKTDIHSAPYYYVGISLLRLVAGKKVNAKRYLATPLDDEATRASAVSPNLRLGWYHDASAEGPEAGSQASFVAAKIILLLAWGKITT